MRELRIYFACNIVAALYMSFIRGDGCSSPANNSPERTARGRMQCIGDVCVFLSAMHGFVRSSMGGYGTGGKTRRKGVEKGEGIWASQRGLARAHTHTHTHTHTHVPAEGCGSRARGTPAARLFFGTSFLACKFRFVMKSS